MGPHNNRIAQLHLASRNIEKTNNHPTLSLSLPKKITKKISGYKWLA